MNSREELRDIGWDEGAIDALLDKHAQEIAEQFIRKINNHQAAGVRGGMYLAALLIREGEVK